MRHAGSGRLGPMWQLPAGPHKVTGVTVRIVLEIILMLRLRLPEVAGWGDFGDHLAGPQMRRFHVRDRVPGDFLLLIRGVEDRRTVARAHVVSLTIERGR